MDAMQSHYPISPKRKRQVNPRLHEPSRQLNDIRYANHILETLPQKNATDPLVFKDLNFLGEDGFPQTSNVTHEELMRFHDFLGESLDCLCVSYYGTFMEIECVEPPAADQWPFSIGGFIAMWATQGTEHFLPLVGEMGRGPACKLDEKFRGQNYCGIPSTSAVEYLANSIFPDCEAISFIDGQLVVEMPETDQDTWYEILDKLPIGLNMKAVVLYHNGPLANTVHARRATQPNPSNLQALIADETDYVARDGSMYPGTMVSSLDEQGHVLRSVSAGIMVQNDRHSCMVCPYHTWEERDKTYPGVLGQGADGDTAGTIFGHLEQCLPNSDIGLVKVNEGIAFENVLMDTDIRPKALVRLDDVKVGENFIFESFVTGREILKCLGRRFPIARRHTTAHPPDSTGYVELALGVFATNTPLLKREPTIREGVCGSMLVRCGVDGIDDQVLERGEVAGMLRYADLEERDYITPTFLILFSNPNDKGAVSTVTGTDSGSVYMPNDDDDGDTVAPDVATPRPASKPLPTIDEITAALEDVDVIPTHNRPVYLVGPGFPTRYGPITPTTGRVGPDCPTNWM